jgi:hypothetical protein
MLRMRGWKVSCLDGRVLNSDDNVHDVVPVVLYDKQEHDLKQCDQIDCDRKIRDVYRVEWLFEVAKKRGGENNAAFQIL